MTHPCRPPSPAQILNHKSVPRKIPHRFITVENRSRTQIQSTSFVDWHKNNQILQLRQYFVRFFTTRLDGRTRFELIDPKPTGDLDRPPENLLWHLFKSKKIREAVRKFTEQAFGKFFVVDPTGMTTFRVRLSNRAPKSDTEEQALDDVTPSFPPAGIRVEPSFCA
ncbi:hypothetical protein [Sphingobium fuliginis]|uniref:hypothetical protein n=1 Tax=Sphingobium fuliginis (strain ATCC 27551) TaxID=336203 RepID=UPI0011AFA129|nr:hypothetical protein [Sphingobium fuliginis]